MKKNHILLLGFISAFGSCAPRKKWPEQRIDFFTNKETKIVSIGGTPPLPANTKKYKEFIKTSAWVPRSNKTVEIILRENTSE